MNHFTGPFKIIPSFSQYLFIGFCILTAFALIIVISLSIELLIKLIACFLIFIWFVVTVREHCWHYGVAIREAVLRTDNVWLLLTKENDQKPVKAELLPGCLVQPWLTVLHFKIPHQRKKSLILLKDNIDPDIFRRLRVRLIKQDA
ncbi:MAG: protein YgfX [Gammaproteobacteria bacterium]